MSLSKPIQSPIEPILSTEVSQESIELILTAMVSQSPSELILLVVVPQSSQVVTKVGGEDLVGLEDSVVASHKSSNLEGVHHPCPTIRKLVGDFKELQLLDGRQMVLPLSIYWFPESESDCLVMEGEAVIGNTSFVNEGHIVSWVDECDGIVDSMFVVTGLEDEL